MFYNLKIERADGTIENYEFENFSDRSDFIIKNWDEEAEFLVPCSFGGWIDVRDIPY